MTSDQQKSENPTLLLWGKVGSADSSENSGPLPLGEGGGRPGEGPHLQNVRKCNSTNRVRVWRLKRDMTLALQLFAAP